MRAAASVVALVAAVLPALPAQAQLLEWARCYDGPGDYVDTALALAMDSAGHVYVTGASSEFGGNPDYVTVKYDAEGDSLWVRRYNSPSNEFDLGRALLPDAEGNLYVTGAPVTIKYSPGGDVLWSHEDFADYVRLAFDRDGNVVAAGSGPGDFKAIKLDPDGGVIWEALYDGPAHWDDRGHDLAVDSEGSVVVAGQSWGLTAKDDGTQWNYTTLKYGPDGALRWARHYDGLAAELDVPTDFALAVAVDEHDNVYVSGWSDGVTDRPECLTIKYSTEGDVLWERRYVGGGACYDLLYDGGFVYAAARGGGGDRLLKYDAEGNLLWARLYATEIGFATNDPRLAADAAGNVYMTSTTTAAEGTRQDFVVLKYTPAGVREWAYVYPDTGMSTTNAAYGLAVDADANVYVTGASVGGPGGPGGYNYLTLKLSQPPVAAEPGAERDFGLSVTPNPVSGKSSVAFTLSDAGAVRVAVYDVLGRAVAILHDAPLAAGAHTVDFHASALMPGIYVVRLEAGPLAASRRLTVLR